MGFVDKMLGGHPVGLVNLKSQIKGGGGGGGVKYSGIYCSRQALQTNW